MNDEKQSVLPMRLNKCIPEIEKKLQQVLKIKEKEADWFIQGDPLVDWCSGRKQHSVHEMVVGITGGDYFETLASCL